MTDGRGEVMRGEELGQRGGREKRKGEDKEEVM